VTISYSYLFVTLYYRVYICCGMNSLAPIFLSVREQLVILLLSIKSFYALACGCFVTLCACVWVIMLFCYLNLYNVCMLYIIKFFQLRFSLLTFI